MDMQTNIRAAAKSVGSTLGAAAALAGVGQGRTVATATTGAGGAFAEQLAAAKAKVDDANKKSLQETRKAAEGLVAHALILPMLKQLRRSTFNEKGPFSPGNGEKAFGPEFDMEIADRMAQSPRMTLTATLTERLASRHLAKATATRTQGVDVRG